MIKENSISIVCLVLTIYVIFFHKAEIQVNLPTSSISKENQIVNLNIDETVMRSILESPNFEAKLNAMIMANQAFTGQSQISQSVSSSSIATQSIQILKQELQEELNRIEQLNLEARRDTKELVNSIKNISQNNEAKGKLKKKIDPILLRLSEIHESGVIWLSYPPKSFNNGWGYCDGKQGRLAMTRSDAEAMTSNNLIPICKSTTVLRIPKKDNFETAFSTTLHNKTMNKKLLELVAQTRNQRIDQQFLQSETNKNWGYLLSLSRSALLNKIDSKTSAENSNEEQDFRKIANLYHQFVTSKK